MFDVIYSYKVKEETGINLQLLTTELHGRMCMEEHVIFNNLKILRHKKQQTDKCLFLYFIRV